MSSEENKKLEERIKQLEKEVEVLRKDDKQTSIEDLESMVASKEKLLRIEMEIAKAFGDTKKQMEQATKLYKILEESTDDAYSAEKVKEYADALGVTEEEMLRLVALQKDLGETGMAAYDMMRSGSEDVAVAMGLVSKRADGIVGGIMKIGKLARDPKGLQGMALALKATFNPLRIFSSLVLKIAENTIGAIIATDKATAAFAKQTGMGRVHTAGIAKLGTEHRNLGIDVELAGKAFTAATAQIDGFNNMTDAQQQKLGLLGAAFERLGVGANEGLAQVESFRKSLGVTTDEASRMTTEMALSARGLGLSMQKYMQGFKSAEKTLAVYGRNAPKVFGKVAAAARAAGVETEALLSLAGKFDTFSDAAETTGKLNAILGTQISAMDMLTMKEDERIEHLIKSMQVSGKQFKDMGKFEQMAVANAAGITDMAQANKIFGMSFKDYKKNQRDMAAQEKKQEEMNKRMKEAMDIGEELKMIMAEFVIKGIGPHIETIKDFVSTIGELVHKVMSGNAPMIATIAALSGIGFVLAPLIGLLKFFGFNLSFIGKGMAKVIGFIVTKTAALFGYTVGQESANNAQRRANRVSAAGTMKMKKLAQAVMMMGIGVGVAAAGVSLLVSSLGQLSGPKMFAVTLAIIVMGLAFAGFVLLMMKMAPATAIAATSLLYLGGAFLLISIGVAIIALGMSILVGTIAELGDTGMAAVGVLWSLAGATFALAGATATLGNPLSMIGMFMLMATMNQLINLATAMQGISIAVGSAVAGLGTLAEDMKFAVEKFETLASADFFAVFAGLYFGIRSFMSALDLNSQHGIQVSHTLENLALIATGKSAKSLDGNVGSAIVNAINRMAGQKEKQTIRLEIDKEAIEQLMRDGYFELESE